MAKTRRVSMAVRTNAVDIIIDDDGPGIPAAKREDVFRPFLRLDESRNPGTGGVGLGLTIARDIARFHGGDVVLENSPLGGRGRGFGCRFRTKRNPSPPVGGEEAKTWRYNVTP